MSTRALSILERERADGFRNFAGTQLEVTLPVTQRLVDMAVARAGARRNLHGLKVTLRAGDEIGVEVVKPVLGFNARLGLVFRIAGEVDLASDSRLYLLVSSPSLTWTAVSRLASAAGLTPEGVSIGQDGIAVDLRALAVRAGVEDLLALARTIEIRGRAGVLVIRAVVDVVEGGVPTREAQRSDPGSSSGTHRHQAVLGDAATLLRELEGARLRGRISISEDLANAAVDLAFGRSGAVAARELAEDGGTAASGIPAPVDGRTLARWIQRARVRFEDRRAVLEMDVVMTPSPREADDEAGLETGEGSG